MKKKKNKIIYIVGCSLIILALIFIKYHISNNKNYFLELTSKEVIEKINNKENFILCVSKTTCSHCKSYKPKLQNVANKYKITTYYIDTDVYTNEEQDELFNYVKITGTPTTIFFKNGEETSTSTRIIGNTTIEKITSKFKINGYIN